MSTRKGICKECNTMDENRFSPSDPYTCRQCKFNKRKLAKKDRDPLLNPNKLICEKCGELPTNCFTISKKTGLYYPKCITCRRKKCDQNENLPIEQTKKPLFDSYYNFILNQNYPEEDYLVIIAAYRKVYKDKFGKVL